MWIEGEDIKLRQKGVSRGLWLTVIGAAAHMHDHSKEVVHIVCIWAVLRRVSQLQLEGKDHSVHQLPHPAHTITQHHPAKLAAHTDSNTRHKLKIPVY